MARTRSHRTVARILIALQIAAFGGVPMVPPVARAQTTSLSPLVRQGWTFWHDEKYTEAIEVLHNALKSSELDRHDRIEALRLTGQSWVRLGDQTRAIESFQQILTLDRTWQPDPAIFQPDEIETFKQAKSTWKPPKSPWWKNRWVLGGGGVAVGGIVYALTQGGDGGDDTGGGPGTGTTGLPVPPDPPH